MSSKVTFAIGKDDLHKFGVNIIYFGWGKSSYKNSCSTAFNNNNDMAYFWIKEEIIWANFFLFCHSFLSLTGTQGGVNYLLAKIVKSQLQDCKLKRTKKSFDVKWLQ